MKATLISIAALLIATSTLLVVFAGERQPESLLVQAVSEPLRVRYFAPESIPPEQRFSDAGVMHEQHFEEFKTTPGFGFSRISPMPVGSLFTLDGRDYIVPKPDLIGLDTETRAYSSFGQTLGLKNLTNEFRVSERPVSDREREAILGLRAGEDIVLQPARFAVREGTSTNLLNGRLMLGALRAEQSCADCHGVEVGTLLGAFSYALLEEEPTNAVRPLAVAPWESGARFATGPDATQR